MNKAMILRVAEAIETYPGRFDVGDWCSECGTRFCIAGWTLYLSGCYLPMPGLTVFETIYHSFRVIAHGPEALRILGLPENYCWLFDNSEWPSVYSCEMHRVRTEHLVAALLLRRIASGATKSDLESDDVRALLDAEIPSTGEATQEAIAGRNSRQGDRSTAAPVLFFKERR